MDEISLRGALSHLPIAEIQFYPATTSTNDLALQWLERGAPDTALVVADSQTAGRGRMQRQWITQPDSALAFSLIIHPHPNEVNYLQFFAPLAGLAVSRTFENLGLIPQIKWPNDVLLERRKACGILVESLWDGNQLRGTVVGIGVNVAPSSIPPAAQLMFPAGCVEQALGNPVNRVALLASILACFIHERPSIGSPAFLQAWQQRLAFIGEKVSVTPPGQPALEGILTGLDSQGNLALTTAQGSLIISAGDVAGLRPIK